MIPETHSSVNMMLFKNLNTYRWASVKMSTKLGILWVLDRGIIFCSSYSFFYPKHRALRAPVKFGTTYAEVTFFGWLDLIQKKSHCLIRLISLFAWILPMIAWSVTQWSNSLVVMHGCRVVVPSILFCLNNTPPKLFTGPVHTKDAWFLQYPFPQNKK